MYATLGGSHRGRRATVLVAAVLAAGLAVAGCSNGSSSNDASSKNHAGDGGGGSASTSSSASPTSAKPDVKVDITPGSTTRINPRTPIQIKTSDGSLQAVTVTNPEGRPVTGTFGTGKTSWTTSEVLGYAKTYKVSIAAADSKGRVLRKAATISTIAPKLTAFPSVVPPPTATNVGVGQPLSVVFDHPILNKVAAQKAMTVTTVPAQAGAWYWLSDTEVHYRPAAYWQAGTRITLHASVYGVDLGGGTYGDTDRTIAYTVHDSWVAKANGNTEQMAIYHNGAPVKTMAISMGKQATPTHQGVHVISAKNAEYTMTSCSYGVCSGPESYTSKEYYAERISNDGEFVHENPNSVGAQGSSNVSHGCINLNQANAIWFFQHFGPGDVVEVYNSGGPALPLGDRYGDWALSWAQWQAGNATTG